MSYTIVGMFPENVQAENATNKLSDAGFSTEDYSYSKYSHIKDVNTADAQYDHYDYEEDEKTSGFWDWLFGGDDEVEHRRRYSYAGSKNNIVTVFAENMEQAEKARLILDEQGAINVHDESRDYVAKKYSTEGKSTNLDEAERARIISKAKNNLYFTDSRSYSVRSQGMDNDMDSQGSNDMIV